MDHRIAATGTPRHPSPHRGGLTLIELVLAVVVLVLAGLAVLGAYQASYHLTEVSQQMGIALKDLKDMMERIKTSPFNTLATAFPNGVVGGGAVDQYGPIVGGYNLPTEQITVTYPTPGTNPLEILVTVTWMNRNRTYSRSLATFRTS